MPILFCEKCSTETEWVYLGKDYVYCRKCGWKMGYQEFSNYRRKIVLREFDEFLQRRKNWLDDLYNEFKIMVDGNPELAAELSERSMKELEKLMKKKKKRCARG